MESELRRYAIASTRYRSMPAGGQMLFLEPAARLTCLCELRTRRILNHERDGLAASAIEANTEGIFVSRVAGRA
jgi:hypothetical protein